MSGSSITLVRVARETASNGVVRMRINNKIAPDPRIAEIGRLLKFNNADPNFKDALGYAAVHYALLCTNEHLREFFFDAFRANVKDARGNDVKDARGNPVKRNILGDPNLRTGTSDDVRAGYDLIRCVVSNYCTDDAALHRIRVLRDSGAAREMRVLESTLDSDVLSECIERALDAHVVAVLRALSEFPAGFDVDRTLTGNYDRNGMFTEYENPTTLLLLAVAAQKTSAVAFLVNEARADASKAAYALGPTPLHVAITTRNLRIVEILTNADDFPNVLGASTKKEASINGERVTPVQLARNLRDWDGVPVLGRLLEISAARTRRFWSKAVPILSAPRTNPVSKLHPEIIGHVLHAADRSEGWRDFA